MGMNMRFLSSQCLGIQNMTYSDVEKKKTVLRWGVILRCIQDIHVKRCNRNLNIRRTKQENVTKQKEN